MLYLEPKHNLIDSLTQSLIREVKTKEERLKEGMIKVVEIYAVGVGLWGR